jgi:hypothetical protein
VFQTEAIDDVTSCIDEVVHLLGIRKQPIISFSDEVEAYAIAIDDQRVVVRLPWIWVENLRMLRRKRLMVQHARHLGKLRALMLHELGHVAHDDPWQFLLLDSYRKWSLLVAVLWFLIGSTLAYVIVLNLGLDGNNPIDKRIAQDIYKSLAPSFVAAMWSLRSLLRFDIFGCQFDAEVCADMAVVIYGGRAAAQPLMDMLTLMDGARLGDETSAGTRPHPQPRDRIQRIQRTLADLDEAMTVSCPPAAARPERATEPPSTDGTRVDPATSAVAVNMLKTGATPDAVVSALTARGIVAFEAREHVARLVELKRQAEQSASQRHVHPASQPEDLAEHARVQAARFYAIFGGIFFMLAGVVSLSLGWLGLSGPPQAHGVGETLAGLGVGMVVVGAMIVLSGGFSRR